VPAGREADVSSRIFGPRSYFPSIEAKYGRSITDWKASLRASGLTSYKELMALLKPEHGFGHGHANALVVDFLKEGTPHLSRAERVDRLFTARKTHWRPTYDNLVREISAFGPLRILPKDTAVGIARRVQFVMFRPATADRFDVDLRLPGIAPDGRLEALGRDGSTMTHRVRLTEAAQVDAELISWLRLAYDASA
jgi:hypothetical protein